MANWLYNILEGYKLKNAGLSTCTFKFDFSHHPRLRSAIADDSPGWLIVQPIINSF